MTDDLTARLAGLKRAMAAPLPSPAELAAWKAEDQAMAERIHTARPGVPLHHVYAVLEALRVVQRVDAAKGDRCSTCGVLVEPYGMVRHHRAVHATAEQLAEEAPSCPWPGCLSEAAQQQLNDDIGKEMHGETTEPGPDPQAACGCDGSEPELTREELQALVDEQGQDLYQARDLLAFIREMCDLNDAGGTPITTTDVRGWLRYTGCGGVLVLPDEAVARLATMSGTTPDKAATSGDGPDIAGEQLCGYVKERWDGPYRLRDRCMGQPGHTMEHGPWVMLP